ncbi:MAG: HNH endonuclease [Candidatus Xenobiia bacterium LiM19]
MKLKEYFTEEPFDIPGVDIPCCTGDYMDIRNNDPSSIEWDENTSEGYHYCACRRVYCLKEGEPLCDLDAVDEFTEKISTRSIDRYSAALEAEGKLDEMLQMRRENDLRLGEVLTLFKEKKGEDYLGHRSIGTFAVEHLDFSGRLASELMHNHEMFSTLQLTKEAFRQGEITKSALRHLSKVLTPDNEAEWLSKARDLPIRALKRAVREAALMKTFQEAVGEEVIEAVSEALDEAAPKETAPAASEKSSLSPSNGAMMCFNVSNRLAPAWDFALEHFRNKEHYNGPISRFVEALLADYITSGKGSGFGAPTPLESGMLPVFYRRYIREDEKNGELLFVCPSVPDEADQHSSGDEAQQHGSEEEDDDDGNEELTGRRIIFPPSFYENPDTLEELTAMLIELGRNRQELDVGIGKILRAIDGWSLYRILNFSHIVEYGKEICELPKPVLYRLITLANRFRRHPLVEKAFRKKLISKEQALQILRVVTAENEMIWIDYAAHVSVITLKEEAERCARIIEYDGFAFISFNILPGFRYITDDRYHELPEEMKDILRTGSWYQRSSPELSWPIEENSDEQMLMEHDPCIDEPWKHFKDIDELEAYKAGITGTAGKNPLCASDTGQDGADVLCASLEPAPPAAPGESGADVLCAPLEPASPAAHGESGADVLCAPLEPASPAAKSGAAASPLGITCKDGASLDGTCSQSTGSGSNSTVHAEETLAKVREICTMPHGADPAETFLMDILEGDSGSRLNDTHRLKCRMSIKFFLPEELFDLWNTVFTIWLRKSVAEEMTDGTKDCDSVEVGTDTFFTESMAEGFLAALLQGWLLTEKAHLRFTRDYAILKRDRFRCQVPGCNCRRNLHVHHIIWRSKGGTDDPANLIVLCTKCHIRLLHNLLTLNIEGTAPHNLTFTFGPRSHGDERPFLKYVRGRKVLAEKNNIMLSK